jgi:mono/diheme cytochrome c family protein
VRRSWLIAAVFAAVALVAVIVLLPKSGGGPEPITYGRDACARCRMVIGQPGLGGEIRDRKGVLTKYDDVGCLLQGMSAMHAEVPNAWVEDQAGSGFVPLLKASFVKDSKVTTPMGHGVIAFREAGAAMEFSKKNGGQIVPLEALLKDPALQGDAPAVATAQPFTDGDASLGRAIYVRECSACHGDKGNADTVAATLLDPKPRDFTKRNFRLRTTESGAPPTSADIERTVEKGIPGTAMPSFAFLTPAERRQAGAYVFRLAGLLGNPEPKPVPDPGAPPPVTPESIAKGKQVYAAMQCGACHGPEGKGDGKSAPTLKNTEGAPMLPRNFTEGIFRGGDGRRDIYYRFVTGMDGTPMPSFADNVEGADRWALVDYVLSLREPPVAKPLPADALAAGRAVAAKYSCRGCHVLDDGKGGDAGPDLRVEGQKLDPAFVKTFLSDPRAYGKVYPWRPSRMPGLKLTAEEIDAGQKYLAAMGHRSLESPKIPDPTTFPAEKLTAGKNVFVIRCAQCHALGAIVATPLASQQGPDLIKVAGRVDYEFARGWILDPKKIDPKTKMNNPGITPEEVDAVRMFVWKSSIDAKSAMRSQNP